MINSQRSYILIFCQAFKSNFYVLITLFVRIKDFNLKYVNKSFYVASYEIEIIYHLISWSLDFNWERQNAINNYFFYLSICCSRIFNWSNLNIILHYNFFHLRMINFQQEEIPKFALFMFFFWAVAQINVWDQVSLLLRFCLWIFPWISSIKH